MGQNEVVYTRDRKVEPMTTEDYPRMVKIIGMQDEASEQIRKQ